MTLKFVDTSSDVVGKSLKLTLPEVTEFPDFLVERSSSWERYVIKYKNGATETHQYSPWELYDADTQLEQPHIDNDIKDRLLHALAKLKLSLDKA
ncbi:Hypothetical predicted protein [Olea europaea subsp. europaea]|uniref:Uncharacterized protein n=1 Tax=Olea europaea subsp. europaea TaxID=158383 RepID=A0A8S0VPB9_OLEEU|nr:Hypothetical predicted protein [Olea europaea subsp. europaea]